MGTPPSRAHPCREERFRRPMPGPHFKSGPELGLTVKSRHKGNDQEPIQSSSTSRPKHQTGEGQSQQRRH